MIKIINRKIYYLGVGNLFKDITDKYLKYKFSK